MHQGLKLSALTAILLLTACAQISGPRSVENKSTATASSSASSAPRWNTFSMPLTWFYLQYPPEWTAQSASGRTIYSQKDLQNMTTDSPRGVDIFGTTIATQAFDFSLCEETITDCLQMSDDLFAGVHLTITYRPELTITEVLETDRAAFGNNTINVAEQRISGRETYELHRKPACETETVSFFMPQSHFLYTLVACVQINPASTLTDDQKKQLRLEAEGQLNKVVDSLDVRTITLRP